MTFSEQPYGALVETTMRVMTWNVWGRFGPGIRACLHRLYRGDTVRVHAG